VTRAARPRSEACGIAASEWGAGPTAAGPAAAGDCLQDLDFVTVRGGIAHAPCRPMRSYEIASGPLAGKTLDLTGALRELTREEAAAR